MLSYQHAYHAGNHADILKHIALIQCLRRLNLKDKPYTVLDTHAGRGLYSTESQMAQKTGEINNGVLALQKVAGALQKATEESASGGGSEEENNIPEAVRFYLNLIQSFLQKSLYPGSPVIERLLMRKDCHHTACELHPGEYRFLKESLGGNFLNGLGIKTDAFSTEGKCLILQKDGLKALEASTPPTVRRGIAVIDPPYEDAVEYRNVMNTIISVHKKWSAGIIFLWYPLLSHRKAEIENMTESIKQAALIQNANTSIVQSELIVKKESAVHAQAQGDTYTPGPTRLYGSGVLVINAPFQLEEQLKGTVYFLERNLYQST